MQLTISDIKLHLSKPIVVGCIHRQNFDPNVCRQDLAEEHLVPLSDSIILIGRSEQFSQLYLETKMAYKVQIMHCFLCNCNCIIVNDSERLE